MKNKKFLPVFACFITVSILFSFLLSGCSTAVKGNEAAAETSSPQKSPSVESTKAQADEPASSPATTVAESPKPADAAATSSLTSFLGKEASVKISYPADLLTFTTNSFVNANGSDLLLDVKINKIEDLADQTLGYDKETALKDEKALKEGSFGEIIDFPYEASKKVTKIGDINAKDFIVFQRFEVCDVVFERKLIFYNNGYQVIITLSANKDHMVQSMPEFFVKDEANCGDLVWIMKDNKSSQDDFYKALQSGSESELAKNWMSSFDLVAAKIEINPQNKAGVSDIIFSTIKNHVADVKFNYDILSLYPEFINMSDGLNSAITGLVEPAESQFKTEVENMGPRDASDDRVYVNTYQGDYSISFAGDALTSLIYTIYSFTGGAHGSMVELSLNYDLVNGAEIKLADLFKPGFDYLKFISDYTIEDITKQISARGGAPDEAWIKEGAGPKEINFQTFVLTKDSLIIKLGQYQVASYAEGLFSVKIPYLAFKDSINPESVINGFIK